MNEQIDEGQVDVGVCGIVDNEGWGGDGWLAGEIRLKK